MSLTCNIIFLLRHSLRRSSAIDSRELPSPLQPLLDDEACGEVLLPVPRQPSGICILNLRFVCYHLKLLKHYVHTELMSTLKLSFTQVSSAFHQNLYFFYTIGVCLDAKRRGVISIIKLTLLFTSYL